MAVTLYHGATARQIVQRSQGVWNTLLGLVVYPVVPWTLGRRPDWLAKNLGDWIREDLCRSK